MLSNDIIDQLVSVSSKLEGVLVSKDNITQAKISHLKNTITTLSDRRSELSETEVQMLIRQLQAALTDLEKLTNKRIELLNFVNKIAAK